MNKANITKIKERRLMTEREVDKEYLGKWVLLDRNGVPTEHSAGYPVAYGEDSKEVLLILEDIGRDEYNGNAATQFGIAERGGITFGF